MRSHLLNPASHDELSQWIWFEHFELKLVSSVVKKSESGVSVGQHQTVMSVSTHWQMNVSETLTWTQNQSCSFESSIPVTSSHVDSKNTWDLMSSRTFHALSCIVPSFPFSFSSFCLSSFFSSSSHHHWSCRRKNCLIPDRRERCLTWFKQYGNLFSSVSHNSEKNYEI